MRDARTQAVAAPPPPTQYAWRHTVGIFKLTIPVDHKVDLREKEERYYAILQFIAKSIPTASRWCPVFERYLKIVGGRVKGFGGDPGLILPSGTGTLPGDGKHEPGGGDHGGEHGGDHLDKFVGKVAGLVYDPFGDFEGFILEQGGERVRRFRSRECRLANILREAWKDRATVIVFTDSRDATCPIEVIIGGPPACCC